MLPTVLVLLGVLPTACGGGSSTDTGGSGSGDETSGEASTSSAVETVDPDSSGPGSSGPASTGPDDTGPELGTTSTSEATTGTEGTTGDDTTDGGQALPPTNGAELLPWLEAGEYLGWAAESGPHVSAGPHGGGVRTFWNDVLLASFQADQAVHPQDAAAVKELYDGGGNPNGWAVMVKVQPDSAGGDGWYWYELYGTTVYADSTGVALCTDCHSVGGVDFVLTPFPLQ